MADWIDREVDVLVVGAGPSGLSLACELRRFGTTCLVIDDDPGPTPEHESRAVAIHAATMEAFHRMGVADRMRDEGRAVHSVGVYRGASRMLDVRMTLSPDESRFPYILVLPQSRTERILLDRLDTLDGEVEWETRLASFRADIHGATAVLEDGSGRTTHVRAKWLVGCDGARSVVRHGLNLSFEGGEYPERFLVADAEVDWKLSQDEASIVLTAEGALLALPLPKSNRWRLIDATGTGKAEAPDEIADRFRALAGSISGLGGKVGEPSWSSSFMIHRRVVDRFRAGRCFVVGDAAHLHNPVGGQGLNGGVQDAVNLAWKLASTLRGEAPESILESYDAERRPVAERVLRQADRAARLINSHNLVVRAARDALLTGLGRIEAFRRRLAREIAQLSVSYPHSPIVSEERQGWFYAAAREGATGFNANQAFLSGPRPGDRMPDILLPQSDLETGLPMRLSDVVFRDELNPNAPRMVRHVLLVFQGTEPESGAYRVDFLTEEFIRPHLAGRIRPILVEPRAPFEVSAAWKGDRLIDSANTVHRRFGALGSCLYLIRPDGYIAFRSRPLDPLGFREYIKKLFL